MLGTALMINLAIMASSSIEPLSVADTRADIPRRRVTREKDHEIQSAATEKEAVDAAEAIPTRMIKHTNEHIQGPHGHDKTHSCSELRDEMERKNREIGSKNKEIERMSSEIQRKNKEIEDNNKELRKYRALKSTMTPRLPPLLLLLLLLMGLGTAFYSLRSADARYELLLQSRAKQAVAI